MMKSSDEHSAQSEQYAEPQEISKQSSPITVVGIGASAGGLSALQTFFETMPADTGMAFVVVTHMNPERESRLPKLLQSYTPMTVHQVRGQVEITPNHVYVIPPGQRILVTDTHLDTEEFEEPRSRRTPVDDFFRSLATAHTDGCVAIILSGGGTDGAVGVKQVKEQGGLLLVQDPEEAQFDSMPRTAIDTGVADVVLPVRELVQQLLQYVQHTPEVPRDADALTEYQLGILQRILTHVEGHTGHDFSRYKRSTVLRRVWRRLQITRNATLDAYLTYLRQDSAEARMLFDDLLISVTNFFRDPEAWTVLAETVIPRLFDGKDAGDSVRVWSIGCATGEEAYSLGILLLEYIATLGDVAKTIEVKIFASDLSDSSLTKARRGVYPEAIEADVSPERLERYFTKENDHYRVRRELRDMVLFADHNLLRDPPFSHVDLISSRNLLIYLNRDVQDQVLETFHYALVPEGYLFLGSAESADRTGELFRTLDKTHRIYQAKPWPGEKPYVPSLPLSIRPGLLERHEERQVLSGRSGTERIDFVGDLHERALEAYSPPSVLVDADNRVLHVSETAGRYLLQPQGPLSNDVLKLVRPALQMDLRTALFQAFSERKAVVSAPVYVEFNGNSRRVTLAVRPLRADAEALESVKLGEDQSWKPSVALVFFVEHEASEQLKPLGEAPEDEEANQALVAQLQDEVQRLWEQLRTTVEKYEASTEELKAANEELQSINEEYRATTEELESSREELQSVNEELQTVNAQLQHKLDEVSQANSDLENLMQATEIATLFLNRDLRIRRYTPELTEIFNVVPSDRDRPIDHLTHRLEYDRLADDARQVLKSLVPVEREVRGKEGHWFLMRIRPYRAANDHIDGVVISFVDITEQKQSEQEMRNA